MRESDFFDDESTSTVWRDVIMLALAGFMMLVIMMLPYINPKAKINDSSKTPGNITVEVRWPDEMNTDVDLWVQAPGDVPVGYSNSAGAVFNLLRDDLGHMSDLTGLNYEFAYSRGAPEGEYTVNLHLYRNHEVKPVPCTVVVSLKANESDTSRPILTSKIVLKKEGDEVTVFRFRLDDKRHLVPGSVHDLPKPLRSASRANPNNTPSQ